MLPQHRIKIDAISKNLFNLIEPSSSILELGPQSGTGFTPNLASISDNLILIEGSELEIENLQKLYPKATVIFDDFHYAIQKIKEPIDNVVIFGVLYHCPGPIKLLEDIVNFLNPKMIFVEALIDRCTDLIVACNIEDPNRPGMRQLMGNHKSSKIVQSISQNVIDVCMENLGYTLVHEYRSDSDPELIKIHHFKESMTYTVWKNTDI